MTDLLSDETKQAMKAVVLHSRLHCAIYTSVKHLIDAMESAIKFGDIDKDYLSTCFDAVKKTTAQHFEAQKSMAASFNKLSKLIQGDEI